MNYNNYNAFNWDTNKDNKIDASDLLAAFDSSNDGQLSGDELRQLAEQLSSQLEYNNMLLNQVHALEQDKLLCQRELQNKQEAAAKMLETIEQQNSDVNEAKRKLRVSQEISDTMSKQSKDSRTEFNELKKEKDLCVKKCQDMKSQLDQTSAQNFELQKAIQEAQNVIAKLKEDAAKNKNDLQSQIEILQHMNQAINKEASDLRAKVLPLESDQRKFLAHIQDLTISLEETTKRCELETEARIVSEKKTKELYLTTEKIRDRHLELQYNIREADELLQNQKSKVDEHLAQAEMQEAKTRECEEKITQLTQALLMAKDENGSLHQELEHMSNELVGQARMRQLEQEKMNAKLEANQAEMQHILKDNKAHAEERIMEAEHRAIEANDTRQKMEDKLIFLQNNCNEVHALLDRLQHENVLNMGTWESQKDNLMQCIMQQKAALDAAESNHQEERMRNNEERERNSQLLRTLKQENNQRGDKYVLTLTAIQAHVKKLRDDFIVERNKVREIVGFVALIKAKVGQLNRSLGGPLMTIGPELGLVFEKMFLKSDTLKESLENAKDEVRRAQMMKEEERSKTLMLEEQNSRLELELASRERQAQDAERRSKERAESQQARIEELIREKNIMEAKGNLIQQTLQETSAHARNLQMTNQNIQAAMGDINSRHTESRQENTEKFSQLASQLKRTIAERDEKAKAVEEMGSQLLRMRRETEVARLQAAQAKQEMEVLQKEVESTRDKHHLTMSAVGGATQKYSQQLKQSQDILMVVQAQRSELEAQNQQLRYHVEQMQSEMQRSRIQN